jgi:hypothetical protein
LFLPLPNVPFKNLYFAKIDIEIDIEIDIDIDIDIEIEIDIAKAIV